MRACNLPSYVDEADRWYQTRHVYWKELRAALVRAVGFGERLQDIITEKCGKEIGARFAEMRRHMEAASELAERGCRRSWEDACLARTEGPATLDAVFRRYGCDSEGRWLEDVRVLPIEWKQP